MDSATYMAFSECYPNLQPLVTQKYALLFMKQSHEQHKNMAGLCGSVD